MRVFLCCVCLTKCRDARQSRSLGILGRNGTGALAPNDNGYCNVGLVTFDLLEVIAGRCLRGVREVPNPVRIDSVKYRQIFQLILDHDVGAMTKYKLSELQDFSGFLQLAGGKLADRPGRNP